MSSPDCKCCSNELTNTVKTLRHIKISLVSNSGSNAHCSDAPWAWIWFLWEETCSTNKNGLIRSHVL